MIYDNGLLVSSGMISEDLFENNDVCYCSLLFISMVTKTKTKPKCKAKYTHCLVHLLKSWVTFLHLLLFSISDPFTMATNNRQITKLFILQIWNLPKWYSPLIFMQFATKLTHNGPWLSITNTLLKNPQNCGQNTFDLEKGHQIQVRRLRLN